MLQFEFNRVLTFIAMKKGWMKEPNWEADEGEEQRTLSERRISLVFDPQLREARIQTYVKMCAYFGMVPSNQKRKLNNNNDTDD